MPALTLHHTCLPAAPPQLYLALKAEADSQLQKFEEYALETCLHVPAGLLVEQPVGGSVGGAEWRVLRGERGICCFVGVSMAARTIGSATAGAELMAGRWHNSRPVAGNH